MNSIRPFRAWCQKVIPLAYDDSLSYYETICKLIKHVNDIGDIVNTINVIDDIDLSNIYFIDTIDNIGNFANTVNYGVLVVNNGKINVIPDNTVFAEGLDIVFISGTFSGKFEIKGKIIADRRKIFEVNNQMTISPNNNPIGLPEWFGAEVNNISVDNSVFITACINTFLTTSLGCGDYFISKTVFANKDHVELYGVGVNQEYYPDGTNLGTRIIQVNNTVTAINIGGGADYDNSKTTFKIHDFSVTNMSPEYANNTAGITVNGARAVSMYNITVSNFKFGYNITNIVLSYLRQLRFLTTKPSANDESCTGFNIMNGPNLPVGISAMVSLYIIDCDVEFVNGGTNNVGVYVSGSGNVADLIIDNINCVMCGTGIFIDCSKPNDGNLQQNVWIKNSTIDNCGVDTIRINGAIKAGIINNWLSTGVWASGTKHCYYHTNGQEYNNVTFSNNIMKSAGDTTSYGVRVVGCYNEFIDCSLAEFSNPVFISDCANVNVNANITNENVDYSANNAIILQNCNRCKVSGSIKGENKYNIGCQLLTCQYTTVDPTMFGDLNGARVVIESVAIANDSIFKALTNGNAIIAPVALP